MISVRESIRDAIAEEMRSDPNVFLIGEEGAKLNAYLRPLFKSAITSRNSEPLAVMVGVDIASKHALLILTGPGTKKQSPVYAIGTG